MLKKIITNKNRNLFLIITGAFLLRFAFFLIFAPWQQEVISGKILVLDASGYHALALKILHNFSFSDFSTFRTPGYPLFLAVIYFLFGIKPWIVIFLQIILNLLSLFFVYKIADKLFDEKAALISAFLFAIEPHQIIYSLTLLSDTLFVTIFLLSVYWLVLAFESDYNKKYFIWSGMALGMATLIRPVSMFFPILILILIFIFAKVSINKKISFFIFHFSFFMLVISPWLIRNYTTYGYAKLATVDGYNLLFYNVAAAEAEKSGKTLNEVRKELKEIAEKNGAFKGNNPFVNAEIYKKISIGYIKNNFTVFIIRHVKGIINMYMGVSSKMFANYFDLKSTELTVKQFTAPSIMGRIIDFFKVKSAFEIGLTLFVSLFVLLSYLSATIGAVYVYKNGNIFALFLLLGIILYFSAVTGAVGLTRYKLPISPFYLIFSANALLTIFKKTFNGMNSL